MIKNSKEINTKKINKKNKNKPLELKKTSETRINKIIGSLNGVKKMIDEGRAVNDILIQISAAYASVKSLANFIIEDYMRKEIIEKVNKGENEVFTDVVNYFKRFQ